ncbi:alpha-ketoacid dehydrogenase kinase [Metschnikowia bicuspidata var. bicuspidata NRRL YB-4993]|uniref:Protein-serine/threonine kinase n=1 Tax=Metschnikowia bicuspidata var. bicuspidata NRRL YB-4993 TaxID=869754 RepID=A0A1A0HB04_9ASCO|nr:alpha-ketoacid dehydrogenase kinase [Metschnikowia bicuspidata var. bicuspidata NRRL YB-4993]OBA21170.1 alpha-ketoacid dehydrogenase kinase [Metschnikowia bicuspidata var. bicuspidata NRRL YB-4993]
MGTGWELTKHLRDNILKYASYPQTSISIRQMVQFGPSPSPGSIFLASQFIVEELPIRLALKVRDLENAPLGLLKMPSTIKVKNWYAQSFEELTSLPKPKIDESLRKQLFGNKYGHDSYQSCSPNEPPRDDSGALLDSSNLAQEQKSNPAVNNVFSDDGIVVRPYQANSSLSASNPRSRKESPTFGKTYYNPCPTNIIWPKEVYDYNKLVSEALNKIKKRHDATVATMAQGVQEWKTEHQLVQVNSAIQTFLDRFYMLRIGIRMLIGQHIALNMAQALPTRQKISKFFNGSNGSSQGKGANSHYVGVISTECNVKEIAEDALETAKYICEDYYGLFEAPEVQLIAPQELVNFMYVPGHLIHMLFEVLKNSLRATIEFHIPLLKQKLIEENPELKPEDIDLNDLKFPPIKVIISEGSEDIAIKISDEGGGIARSEIPLIWTYLYTTVDKTPTLDAEFNQTTFKAPMAGFGYGLPISRLYAQYFGGDLKLISMEGYGTDVYIHLNRLSSSLEPLP